MSAVLNIGHRHPQGPASMSGALAELWKAWTAHTLKRAIADVASMRDQDYREFGLDKAEILAALRRLRDAIEDDRTFVATHPSRDYAGVGPPRLPKGCQLAISVARREPDILGGSRAAVGETT